MARRKTIYVDSDILVVGGGFGGCGAAYESRYWGRDKKVVLLKKQISNGAVPLHKGFMRLTATWVCSGVKTLQKITSVINVTT
jgi:ribulose 1,5-bisphosphate synthetase/thiazole synthase